MSEMGKRDIAAPAEPPNYRRLATRLDSGPGAVARIGLVALANDVVIEGELRRMIGDREIGLHASRIPVSDFGTVEALAELQSHVRRAADLLPADRLGAIAFGCTSAAAAIGSAKLTTLINEGRAKAIPCIDPIAAATAAFKRLGVRRIALLCPYVTSIAAMMAQALRHAEFEVTRVTSFEQAGDDRISRIPTAEVRQAALEMPTQDCDALFISCTALRIVSSIDEIESAIGRPVVTSNQALFWAALAACGATPCIEGYGALLSDARPADHRPEVAATFERRS